MSFQSSPRVCRFQLTPTVLSTHSTAHSNALRQDGKQSCRALIVGTRAALRSGGSVRDQITATGKEVGLGMSLLLPCMAGSILTLVNMRADKTRNCLLDVHTHGTPTSYSSSTCAYLRLICALSSLMYAFSGSARTPTSTKLSFVYMTVIGINALSLTYVL
jgi:hypothetical protein